MVRLLTVLLAVFNLILLAWLCSPAPAGEEKTVANSLAMKFALIPAGKFQMGSPESEKGRGEDETQHEVAIRQPFYLGVYEVTQEQYAKVMGENPSWFSPQGGGKESVQRKDLIDTNQLPVDDVTWQQADAFCRKLGQLPVEKAQGRRYRLPTEAEWEYACRAGTTTVFHYGNSLNAYQANFCGLQYASYGEPRAAPFLRRTTKVGDYLHAAVEGKDYPSGPNAFGLLDMHGNVQEWCQDWYAADYYKHSPKDDPAGPETGTERVLRGGGWPHSGKAVRSAVRNKLPPEETHYSAGFRVVMIK